MTPTAPPEQQQQIILTISCHKEGCENVPLEIRFFITASLAFLRAYSDIVFGLSHQIEFAHP